MSSPTYRPLTRSELDLVLGWAADEGWNPGLADADAFWAADPEGFVGIEKDGELIGSGAIISYAGEAGFMGLFIVKTEWRGKGIGGDFWFYRRDLLRSRLREDALIAMDGVFEMQPFYARGGFAFQHRNLRMQGKGKAGCREEVEEVEELAGFDFSEVAALDRRYFGAPRGQFLKKWIQPIGGLSVGVAGEQGLAGMGVIRPCREGFKIGPLYAESPGMADSIFRALSNHAAGEPLFLDVPECHPEAMKLAERHGLKEVFGCARMAMGTNSEGVRAGVYGVTTFELG